MKNQNKLEPFLKKYSDNTLLRASINALPFGGSLDIMMTSGIQKKSQERYLYFIDELRNQFEKIKSDMVDYDYLDSEEFFDLYIETSNLVVKTRLQEKVKAYTKILTSSLTNGFKGKLKPEDILNIIKDLTENDIVLIKLISEYLNSDKLEYTNSTIIFNHKILSEVSQEYSQDYILVGLLNLLKNSLIIKDAITNGPLPFLRYQITPIFEIVRDYLKK